MLESPVVRDDLRSRRVESGGGVIKDLTLNVCRIHGPLLCRDCDLSRASWEVSRGVEKP